MKKVILFFLILMTTSCSLPQQKPVTIKELLPVGSTLRLNQELKIPKDRTFIYIANGKVAPLKNYNTVDIYNPYCMFYLNNDYEKDRVVKPDEFTVTKIIEVEGYYSESKVIKLASADLSSLNLSGFMGMGNDDGGANIIMYATVMTLHSEKQPGVTKIVCGHWDEQSRVEPLRLEEMKTALGSLISINIK